VTPPASAGGIRRGNRGDRFGNPSDSWIANLDLIVCWPIPDGAVSSGKGSISGSTTVDAAQEALAGVLAAEGLRPGWFELRALVKVLAEKAAADYAALTHEAPRTIEHVASVNAWDGQHEKSSLEVLGPEHERAFMDAACGALGVVLIRPYVGEQEFARFWAAYEPVFGTLR